MFKTAGRSRSGHISRIDAMAASLKRAKANVKRARASVLKAAVEGRLVPAEAALARAEGCDYEPASVLLAHILTERRARPAPVALTQRGAAHRPGPTSTRTAAGAPSPRADRARQCSLDLFWLKDDSLLDADSLPDPDIIAQEIADDLHTAH